MENLNKKEIATKISEIIPQALQVNVGIEKRKIPLPSNIMVFQTFAYLAATTLKPSTNKILMLFFANSGYENYIGMDVVSIAEKLSISERSVISSLKELEINNIIVKISNPVDRRRNDYFLNPFASWRGNSYARQEFMKETPDNQLDLFGEDKNELIAREKREIKAQKAELGSIPKKNVQQFDPTSAIEHFENQTTT